MKRFCAVLCAFVLVIVLGLPVAAEGINGSAVDIAPDIMAPAAYVVNLDTNIVVYEKNSETPLQAASLTKMMTTLLLLENYQDQLDTISVTAHSYIYDLIWEKTTNASTADIRKGETQTLRNLLYAMMLPSANEAAYIVADYMGGGSIDNFVAMMNEEAARIGCTGTTFADPCGLDTNNVTTARDAYLCDPEHGQNAERRQRLLPQLCARRQDRQPGRVAELRGLAHPGRHQLHQRGAQRAL